MSDTSDISARQAVLLDAELIRRRRINLRMTERQLGRLVGKSGQLVRRIEAGLSHEGVTVRVAHRLAEALDVPLPMLFLQEVKRSEGAEAAEAGTERNGIEADLACIGALLAECGDAVPADVIATALGMSLSRVDAGIIELGRRLLPLGIVLSITGSGVAISPDPSALPATTAERVCRALRGRRPLGTQEARMLVRVLRGEVGTGASLDRPSGMVLGKLAKAGAVELPAGRWAGTNPPRLAPDVRYSLMLAADVTPDPRLGAP